MSTKEDKNRTADPTTKCCQNNEAISSMRVSNGDGKMKGSSSFLTSLITPSDSTNNNKKMCDIKREHYFPKRQAVDVEFQNVTFTSWSWSMTRFQKGNILAFSFHLFIFFYYYFSKDECIFPIASK